MLGVVIVAGVLAQVVVWRLAAHDRLPFWPATSVTFAGLAIASLLAGDPACCARASLAATVGAGAASGLLLYAATRVVVDAAMRRPALHRSVVDVYRRSTEAPLLATLVLSLAIAVPGEELFWRGIVLPELREGASPASGALLAWAAAVGVNAAWSSAPLLAGAVVGGALWTALGVWSGGVVAPIASHAVWTGLMLVWPPRAARGKVPP